MNKHTTSPLKREEPVIDFDPENRDDTVAGWKQPGVQSREATAMGVMWRTDVAVWSRARLPCRRRRRRCCCSHGRKASKEDAPTLPLFLLLLILLSFLLYFLPFLLRLLLLFFLLLFLSLLLLRCLVAKLIPQPPPPLSPPLLRPITPTAPPGGGS